MKDSARTADGRDNYSQLASLVEYFNRNADTESRTEIDWDHWRETIQTPGVVDKVEAKYNEFMEATYDVQDAASRVNSRTEKLANMDVAVAYNYALWAVHYSSHLRVLETLNAIGDITELSEAEVGKYLPEIGVLHQAEMDIGNISPECYIENGVSTRTITQFAWGSRYNPPFVHSSDALLSLIHI